MSLRRKLFLILSLMTVIPLLVLQFGVVERVERDLLVRIEAELQATLKNMSEEVNALLNSQKSVAKGLAKVPIIRDFAAEIRAGSGKPEPERLADLHEFFLNYQRQIPYIQAIRIIDHTGKTLVKVKEGRLIDPELYDPEMDRHYIADQSSRAFFHEAISGDVDVYVSDFELGQVQVNAEFCPAMMRYSVPIRDKQGQVLALLVVNMWGERIDDTVLAAMGGYAGQVFIVEINEESPSRDGIYLFHKDNQQRFANQLGTSFRFSSDIGMDNWIDMKWRTTPGYRWLEDGRMLFHRHFTPYANRDSGWMMVIETSQDAVFEPLVQMRNSIWVLLAVLLMLSLLIGRWVAARLAFPVHTLAQRITQYADGEQQVRYDERRNDEIGIAGRAFNYLCERLENAQRQRDKAEQAVRHSERLAAVGQMAAGIGHEINNPLMNIMSLASLIEQSLPGDSNAETRQDLKTLQDEGQRCARIVQGILNFARANQPVYTDFNLNKLIDETLSLLRHRVSASGLKFETHMTRELSMQGDANQLQQVLVNVLINAIHASPEGGLIRIETEREDEFVRVAISDQGSGVKPEDVSRIFNPFFTTKPEGQGTGLGLSVSYGIVRKHGGNISVENRPDGGATVQILLPLEARPSDFIEEEHAASESRERVAG